MQYNIVWTQVQELAELQILQLDNIVNFIDCSSDGALIACGIDNQIRIYDSSLTILIATLVVHSLINQVKFFQSSRIASCSDDETVRVWDAQTFKQLAILSKYPDPVTMIEFQSESSIIVVGENKTIIWNIHEDQQITIIMYYITDIKQLPKQQIIFQDIKNCLKFWDYRTKKCVKSLNSVLSYNRSVVTLNNIITGGWPQKSISFLDTKTGKVIRNFQDDQRPIIHEIVLHPSSEFIIICEANKQIRTWQLLTGIQASCTNYNHDDQISAITISKDGDYVFSGGLNKTIRRTSVRSMIYKD